MTTEQREPLYASTAKPWLKYYDQKYIDMPLPKCSADPRHFGLNRCFTALLRNVHSLFLDILRRLHYNRDCIVDSNF